MEMALKGPAGNSQMAAIPDTTRMEFLETEGIDRQCNMRVEGQRYYLKNVLQSSVRKQDPP